MTKNNQITEGVIWKQLLLFFFPIMLGAFFQQLYNTVDAIVVGRFVGTNALAAVGGSSGKIIGLIVGFFTGLTTAAAVSVSQAYGSGDVAKANRAMHTLYAFSVVGSVIITILGLAVSPWLLSVMNTPEELMEESLLYLNVYFSGVFFVFIYNTGASILRALGDSKRPFIYLIVCCGVNIVLDLLCIVALDMGVAGAAIATLISQAISAVLVTRALMRSAGKWEFRLQDIRIHGEALQKQLSIGLPGGIQGSMYSLANIVMQTSINAIGASAVAAWTAHGKLDAIFWALNSSMGVAVTTFVGQNYGAGRFDRVLKSTRVGLGMDMFFAASCSTLLLVFRVPLISIFTDDPGVVEIASTTLGIIAPFYIVFPIMEILSCSLRGMGDVFIPMIMTILGICGFRVAWALFVVPHNPSMEMISVNYPVSWIVTAGCFVVYWFWRVGKVKRNKLK